MRNLRRTERASGSSYVFEMSLIDEQRMDDAAKSVHAPLDSRNLNPRRIPLSPATHTREHLESILVTVRE